MSNQNQTAVEWLWEQYKLVGMLTTAQVEKAKAMESKKQHKYDEMLDMLNRIRLGELPEQELRQLIKEATILP